MKYSLQFNLVQQLTMSPQLQQSIKLLQLSAIDLQHEVDNLVEANPMLEIDESNDSTIESLDNLNEHDANDGISSDLELSLDDSKASTDVIMTDASWNEEYTDDSAGKFIDEFDFFDQSVIPESLQEHLSWQLNLISKTDKDQIIAMALIDSIDANGYLSCSLHDITMALKVEKKCYQIIIDDVKVMQRHLQQFDPLGCCCENLRESLLVQLAQIPSNTVFLKEAKQLINQFHVELENRNYYKIMKLSRMKENQIQQALLLIQTLNPRPGSVFGQNKAEYIVPDIVVKKEKRSWVVHLNNEILPRLKINTVYPALIKQADTRKDSQFMKNHLQEARCFLKNLQNRNDTLLKVSRVIIEMQKDFFEYGDEALKPLILSDVAKALDMHESTISRVTSHKFIHTPKGIYELKFFFSNYVGATQGQCCSSKAVRAFIKKIIQEENPKKPLSDAKIATFLMDQGVTVARRTISKYRESMRISSSSKRKRLV